MKMKRQKKTGKIFIGFYGLASLAKENELFCQQLKRY